MPCKSVKIIEPIDGAILNRHDGKQSSTGLAILVSGIAPTKSKVTVNNVEAKTIRGSTPRYHDEFTCNIVLKENENRIVALAKRGRKLSTDAITVLWDRNSIKRYRFSVDDNILFLKDLSVNSAKYSSIFDNAYMTFWKEMHETYGAKIHLNIYYQTDGFNLSQMPDRYKPEWEENSDWLRLSFHALQDQPPRPYKNASYQEIEHNFLLVTREIERFAGRKLLSPFTTVHWGEVPLEACRALRNNGINGLAGYFILDPESGDPRVSYYLDKEKTKYLNEHDYWKDTKEGIFFITHDLVINNVKPDQIAPTLDSIASNPHRSEVLEVMIHEQYFCPQLRYYEPDAKERVINTLEWLTRKGYKSVFYEEGFLGA